MSASSWCSSKPPRSGTVLEPARQEDQTCFSFDSPGEGVRREQVGPLARRTGALLEQLPLRRQDGSSPGTSSSPAGSSTSRIPTGWRYCSTTSARSVVVDGQHHHRTGVVDDQAGRSASGVTGRGDDVAADGERRRAVSRPARPRGPARPRSGPSSPVGLMPRSTARRIAAWSSGISSSFCRAIAAPTSPANSGCGLVGPAAQLGVCLGGDVVRVHLAGQLDELDQLVLRADAGEDQAGLPRAARGRRCSPRSGGGAAPRPCPRRRPRGSPSLP